MVRSRSKPNRLSLQQTAFRTEGYGTNHYGDIGPGMQQCAEEDARSGNLRRQLELMSVPSLEALLEDVIADRNFVHRIKVIQDLGDVLDQIKATIKNTSNAPFLPRDKIENIMNEMNRAGWVSRDVSTSISRKDNTVRLTSSHDKLVLTPARCRKIPKLKDSCSTSQILHTAGYYSVRNKDEGKNILQECNRVINELISTSQNSSFGIVVQPKELLSPIRISWKSRNGSISYKENRTSRLRHQFLQFKRIKTSRLESADRPKSSHLQYVDEFKQFLGNARQCSNFRKASPKRRHQAQKNEIGASPQSIHVVGDAKEQRSPETEAPAKQFESEHEILVTDCTQLPEHQDNEDDPTGDHVDMNGNAIGTGDTEQITAPVVQKEENICNDDDIHEDANPSPTNDGSESEDSDDFTEMLKFRVHAELVECDDLGDKALCLDSPINNLSGNNSGSAELRDFQEDLGDPGGCEDQDQVEILIQDNLPSFESNISTFPTAIATFAKDEEQPSQSQSKEFITEEVDQNQNKLSAGTDSINNCSKESIPVMEILSPSKSSKFQCIFEGLSEVTFRPHTVPKMRDIDSSLTPGFITEMPDTNGESYPPVVLSCMSEPICSFEAIKNIENPDESAQSSTGVDVIYSNENLTTIQALDSPSGHGAEIVMDIDAEKQVKIDPEKHVENDSKNQMEKDVNKQMENGLEKQMENDAEKKFEAIASAEYIVEEVTLDDVFADLDVASMPVKESLMQDGVSIDQETVNLMPEVQYQDDIATSLTPTAICSDVCTAVQDMIQPASISTMMKDTLTMATGKLVDDVLHALVGEFAGLILPGSR